MMRLTVFIFLFYSCSVFGQNITDSLLTTFYNRTLTSYFHDTTRWQSEIKFSCNLLQTYLDTTNIIKKVGTHKFKFMNSTNSIKKTLDKPFKINNGRMVYQINHKLFNKDTLDVNIIEMQISISKNHVMYSVSCGGTMGYIPDGRFTYSKNEWTFTSGKEILDEKVLEFEKKFKKTN